MPLHVEQSLERGATTREGQASISHAPLIAFGMAQSSRGCGGVLSRRASQSRNRGSGMISPQTKNTLSTQNSLRPN